MFVVVLARGCDCVGFCGFVGLFDLCLLWLPWFCL